MRRLSLGQVHPRAAKGGAALQAALRSLYRNRAAKAGIIIFGAAHFVVHFTIPLADLLLHAGLIGSIVMGAKTNV